MKKCFAVVPADNKNRFVPNYKICSYVKRILPIHIMKCILQKTYFFKLQLLSTVFNNTAEKGTIVNKVLEKTKCKNGLHCTVFHMKICSRKDLMDIINDKKWKYEA